MIHSARYILVLLLVLAACAGSLIFCTDFGKATSKSGKYTPIFSEKQFTESELIQIELAFADAKLSDYVISDASVHVPGRQKTQYMLALKKARLFTDDGMETQKSGSGFWVSEEEREAAALREKQNTLAAQIRTFHGIESAKILLDVSETKCGFTREKHASAAVSIRSRANYSVTESDIQSILHLITCSVYGLKPANVTIVDTRTNQSWRFDAPQVEILPESPSESQPAAKSIGSPNLSRKIVIETEPLPQPQLLDSVAMGILQPNEVKQENFIYDSNVQQASAISELIPVEPEKLPELMDSQDESSEILMKPQPRLNRMKVPPSNQCRHEISVFLGLATALVSFVCILVIVMTRKGLHASRISKSALPQTHLEKEHPEESLISSQSEPLVETGILPEVVSDPREKFSEILETLQTIQQEEFADELESFTESARESQTEVPPNVEAVTESDSLQNRIPELADLESVIPNRLALALLEERAQTAAMILTRFAPENAKKVLEFIPSKLRLGIESRMNGCTVSDAEILREAAQAILEHIDELTGDGTALEETTESEVEKTADFLKSAGKLNPRPLAEVLPHEKSFHQFEDLNICTDGELQKILNTVPIHDTCLAFLGAAPEIVNRVLDVLPKEQAEELHFQMNHPGRIRLMEVEEARQRVLEYAEMVQ